MPKEIVPIASQLSTPQVNGTPAEQIVAITPPSAKQDPSSQKRPQIIKMEQKECKNIISTIQETEHQHANWILLPNPVRQFKTTSS